MSREGLRLEELSVRGILQELLRNLWVIIVTGLAVWLSVTGVGKLTYKPQYTSSATLVVSVKNSTSSYNSLYITIQMASVFSEVFQSDALRKTIIEDVGEPINASISCQSIAETNLIVLKATADNPRHAYLYINFALENYKDVSEYVYANASLDIVESPTVPSYPSNVSGLIMKRDTLTVLSMMGMAGIVLLFYLFRYTVKNGRTAERQLDGTVLGIIPFEKKIKGFNFRRKKDKRALLLTSSLVSMMYAEATRRMVSRLERHMHKHKQKVLLVSSIGENEGKSTVSANIAIALSEKHKKVLVIEGDFRKPAQYKVFERRADQKITFKDVLEGKASWKDAVVYNTNTRVYELFLFQALRNPAQHLDTALLEKMLSSMREEMDYIIIDSSPIAAASDAEVWMHLADTATLVVREDWSDVRVINDAVDMIWLSCDDYAGFVLNAFQEGTHFGSHYGYGYATESAE